MIAIVRNLPFYFVLYFQSNLFYFIVLCFCSEGRDVSIKAQVSHPSLSLTCVYVCMIKNNVRNSLVMVVLVSY